MSKRNRRKKQRRRQKRRDARVARRERETPVNSEPEEAPKQPGWEGPTGRLGTYIAERTRKRLDSYRADPIVIERDANEEEDTSRGGYAHRQLFELVQNSADALANLDGGRIEIRLASNYLYCADNGRAINEDGVKALMFSHLSPKRGTAEIGRFGLGFKSVLGVTDTPDFFSRAGSFRFDRSRARQRVEGMAPALERYPVLSLPEAIDPCPEIEADEYLRELTEWAVNIVRLPLKPGSPRVPSPTGHGVPAGISAVRRARLAVGHSS